jgi:Domain of unknown function (DUF6378)
MNRTEVLKAAEHVITKDRQDQYGNAEDSFATIAGLWSNYLGTRLSEFDVSMMMTLLKVARAKSNPNHTDNLVDIAGYAALAAEMLGGGM